MQTELREDRSDVLDQWDLLSIVLSIFLDNLPLAKDFEDPGVQRKIPLIRAQAELMGLNLFSGSQRQHDLLRDSFEPLVKALDAVLDVLESFVDVDFPSDLRAITVESANPRGYTKLTKLKDLHFREATASGSGPSQFSSDKHIPLRSPAPRSFLNFQKPAQRFMVLLQVLTKLNLVVEDAFEETLAEIEVDTRTSDADLNAVKRAEEFCAASIAVYELLARQTEECPSATHDGALHLSGFEELELLFPLCKEDQKWHPTTCIICERDQASQEQRRRLPMDNICNFVRDSKRRRKTARVVYTKNSIWKDRDPSSIDPMCQQLRVALCGLIDPGHSDSCPLHNDSSPEIAPADRKRLSVILARSLLHLYGSPWIQHDFSLGKLFLSAADPASLRGQHPYLHCSIPSIPLVSDQHFVNDICQDDIWKHSLLVSFGLRLLEIESRELIIPDEQQDFDFETKRVAPFYTLDRALRSLRADGRVEDAYLKVAQSCLDFEDELSCVSMPHLRPETNYRLAIYKFIFNPLLEQLIQRFREHALDLLETQISSQCPSQPKDTKEPHALRGIKNTIPAVAVEQTSIAPFRARGTIAPVLSLHSNAFNKHPLLSSSVSMAKQKLSMKLFSPKKSENNHPMPTKMAMSLFDESQELVPETDKRVQLANKFFAFFEDFRQHMQPTYSKPRVKIAVLDTGIDADQLGLRLSRDAIIEDRERADPSVNGDPIKAARSFIEPHDDFKDACGHGTHIAEILLRLAPEADLYIAKISNSLEVDKVDQIAEAIEWALEYDCDIISMSFGMNPSSLPEASLLNVQNAIHRVATARKIMLAAASNCGGNGPRTYPASDPSVICVHASDGNGNDGGINPPVGDHPDYFSTLGIAIKCFWDEQYVYKSGTSFATPVAAAIAANVLDYATYSVAAGRLTNQRYGELRQSQGMKKVFTKFMSVPIQHYRYVAPWHFWKTGVTDEYIWQRLNVDFGP